MTGDDVDDRLLGQARSVLEAAWVPEGYAAPNLDVYPFQWLWDSCFHALVWARLGRPERAVTELTSALSTQADDGFVPHMNYVRRPDAHADLWGRTGASGITQPPMYGHAVAELVRRGVDVPPELVDRCRRGLAFLLGVRPRHRSGLVELCHPWESGCDDSPRWDDACPGGFDPARWYEHKGRLVATIRSSATGSPLVNPGFDVASVGFTALVAFNALELAPVIDAPELEDGAAELVGALDDRWDAALGTWVDAGSTAAGSGRVRSLDGLLPVLVPVAAAHRDRALAAVVDPAAYGGVYGPAGVHRAEPVFDPRTYWRGPAWPQLSYLLWFAARRVGHHAVADALAVALRTGALQSGFAEYWDPDDGTGLGAIPQTWTALAALV